MRAIRWGDNDHYFGPITWHPGDYKRWSIVLVSAGDEDRKCHLRISMWRYTLITVLPNIIKPHREKVYPQSWDAETVKRLGRNWYWSVDQRQYGFGLYDGHFNLYYGRTGGPSMDSRVEQRWSCFLPWTQWRHVRHSYFDLNGEHFATLPDTGKSYRLDPDRWERERAIADSVPTAAFAFEDFDGERLIATTRIEEREWRFGTGYFKWLSLFRRPKIRRSLDLRFSGETGTEKGSWKGGTIGTGIDMLPGELHEAAFRRYCDQEHSAKGRSYRIKFVGTV